MRWSRQADERGGRYGGGGTRLILGPGQRGGNIWQAMLLRTASNVLRNSMNICVRRVYTRIPLGKPSSAKLDVFFLYIVYRDGR